MIAWDILVANSTAPAASIAWVHLNSHGGGGTVIVGGIRFADITQNIAADVGEALASNIETATIEADIGTAISADTSQQILEASICQV